MPTRRLALLLPVPALLLAACGADSLPSPDSGTRHDMLEQVVDIAKDAGAVLMRHYADVATGRLRVETKDDDSPVTKADKDANRLIVDRLQEVLPGVPAIAEESDLPPYEERKAWTRFWLVDPLDGTKEFLKRNGEFTVNIALIEDGEPVLGVIYAPAFDVVYYAAKGEGAFKREGEDVPQRLRSKPPGPGLPIKVLMSRSHAKPTDVEATLPGRRIERLIPSGSALKFGLLAEGVGDVYIRTTPTSEWDVAAGDCIYRESGSPRPRTTPFRYNKPSVKNEGFAIGLDP